MRSAYPIEFRDVTFTHPGADEPTLKGLNLKIQGGEFVGIIGPTASGKSTLLMLMSGAIPHYLSGQLEGEVLIYGQRTEDLSLGEITERIGLVMQDPEDQLFNLLVRDEIVWGLENRGVSRDVMVNRLEEALRFFSIEGLEQRITHDLSGGEKQKVALSAIYAIKPSVLLFDNPTSQLDPIGSMMVFEAIRRITEAGEHTVVMVEDKVDELLEHADRLVLLAEGEIVLDGSGEQFCLQKDLLDRVGVLPSQVVSLTYELAKEEVDIGCLPLTLESAVEAYGQLINNRRREAGA